MKFYIVEKNIGDDVTRQQTEKVIEMLQERGWNVEYGMGKKQAHRYLGIRTGRQDLSGLCGRLYGLHC